MQFYNFQGSPGNDRKEDDFLDRLQTAVKAFEREASTTKTIHADSDSIQQLLNIFSDILEDGFEGPSDDDNDSSHYWSTVSSVIDSIPMRFVGSLEKFDTDSEKAIVWILIELYSKNLSNMFNDILNKPQILQFYSERATIRLKASKIKEILGKLDQMNYSIESKFLKVYEENKDQFGDEEEEEEGEPSDNGSVFVRDSNTSQQTTGWASNLYQRKTQESDSYSRNTTSDLTRPVSHREPTVETTPTPTDMSKSQPVQIKRLVTHVDEVKQNLQRYKTLLKRPTLVGRDDDEEESNTFVRDGYRKDFEERNKNTPFGFISRVLVEPMNSLKGEVTKKIMRKSSSYDKIDARKQSGKGDYVRSRGNLDEPTETGNRRESRRSRRSSYEFKRKETGRGHSKDQDEGYRSGLREFRASELRSMKNSQLLYYQKYQGIQLQFEYRAQPVQMVTAEQQGYKCFDCGIELNKILLKIWPRKSYCHYTGYWYCSTCMGKEKHLIPWYVKSNFDFTLYHVCKKAREELKKFYDKPNMLFDHKEKVVLDNKDFYDTLVMKRQLHLMFDMICESPYVLDLLGANANLLLKQNLFSMKNLSEIKNGTMTRYMEKCYAMLTSHVNGCSICQAKGKCCPVCNNKTKIFPYDIRNTSVCRNCKYLYHSRCLQLKKCIVCQHNS